MADIERLKELTILYAEDEDDLREIVLLGLSRMVGKVFPVKNGKEGLEVFKKEAIDIIISDINMPVMDGLEMVKNIRDENEDIPIIITTAYSDVNFLKRSIDLQVDKYITKPINIRQLVQVLNRASEVIFHKRELAQKDLIIRNNEKVKALGELMENVSHQWRQPLAVISMCAENIIMEKELDSLSDESLKSSCDEIIETSKNLSNILDEFREYFNAQSSTEEIKLDQLINQFYENIINSFEQKNIKIFRDLEPLIINGIKNNFLQILYNITNNAKDALERSKEEERLIFIDLKQTNGNIILNIKDNAGGINDQILTRIFDPYFTTKHKAQGTGLNLFIVHELITKDLNGHITAQNVEYTHNDKEYKGALFKITLPIEDQ